MGGCLPTCSLTSSSCARLCLALSPLANASTDARDTTRSDKHVSRAPGETTVVPTKQTLAYVPLSLALEHSFASMKKRELKRTGTVLWGVLGAPRAPLSDALLETGD